MRLSLRWKIALGVTVVAAVTMAVLAWHLSRAAVRHGAELMQQSLLAQVRLAALSLPEPPWQPGVELDASVRRVAQALGARVTLIAADGTVVADSEHDPATMENHGGRPERLQALQEGVGSAIRFSRTLDTEMLYVAVRVGAGSDSEAEVVRLARPMTEVRALTGELRGTIASAAVIWLLAVWLLSVWLGGSLAEPLARLVHVARRVRDGDLGARVQELPPGELNELGAALNQAVGQLAELVEGTRQQQRYYQAILDQMTDGVVVTDGRGQIQFVNRNFARLFGIDADQVRGRSLESVTLSYPVSLLLERALAQGGVPRDEVHLVRPEARVLSAVATRLVDEQGQAIGAVGLLHDVTPLRRADEIRRDFVANASHELRTPAAGIKALAEALQAGALSDPERGPVFVERIVESADRLTEILDDMLTLTRVERWAQMLHPEYLLAAEAARQALAQVQAAAEERHLTTKVTVPEGDKVYADPSALETVLVNLLDNAVKYTEDGGEVEVIGAAVPGGYELSVRDTGIGIPAAHLDRIFERFYRVDRARARDTGGTGLGLSIVKHIVETHGGRVRVVSEPGRGSTFTAFFPNPTESSPAAV